MKAAARQAEPLHVSVEQTLRDALAAPGLQHIKTKVSVCTGADMASANIEFLIEGAPCGVSLIICSGGSFVLVENRSDGKPTTINWAPEEVDPDSVTAAVLGALRRRVVDPVAT